MENVSNNTNEAYAQFEKWLSNQPYWLQDAAYRIYNGLEINEKQISAYVDMCIMQARKQKPKYNYLEPNETISHMTPSTMAVQKIYNIVGVNALAMDASLEFLQDGITVVYGLNGAGKSGFMRIFKQLSGCQYKEAIQPNVYKKGSYVEPTCTFRIIEDNQEQEISCNLTSLRLDSPLVDCDVFDTRISNEYITKNNNVSYQPFVFTALTELANTADSIRRQIDRRIDSISIVPIMLPNDLSERDDLAWVLNLSASTVIPEQFGSWTKDQQQNFDSIAKRLDTDKLNSNYRLCNSQIGIIKPVLEDLVAAKAAIKSNELIEAYSTFIKSRQILETAETLFTETADEIDKVSVKVADWKELWQIAQRYYNSVIHKGSSNHFGEEGTICPLCHQPITGKNFSRFKSVNEYVNGTCNEDYSRAMKNLRKHLEKVTLRSYSEEQISNQLSPILEEDELVLVEEAYKTIGARTVFEDIESEFARVSNINIDKSISLLQEKEKTLEDQLEALEFALKDEGRKVLREQYDNLKCHKWVYDNKTIIENEIGKLKKRQELSNTKQFITTNRITNESNRLASLLISGAYIERFTNELRRLAPKIKVKLEKAPSQKGSTPYKVTIDTDSGIKCKPEDILSEGEQRIVALAAFFADATGRETKTPLIIDDPISSLDINYENAATKRIVEIALDRQVIVFTHRISMLTGIEELCKRYGVEHKENYIRSTNRGKGVSDFADIYRGSVKTQLKGIKARYADIKKMDQDSSDFSDAIGRVCQQFRICVERAVEDVLLQGMVHRFERGIMTKGKITKLTRMTENDCRIIDSMMTKYSFTEHSQPIDSPPIEISPEELLHDIDDFLKWIDDYQKRMK